MLTRRLTLAAGMAALGREVAAAERWEIVTEYPASAIPGEGVAFFAAAASERSGGSLRVEARFDGPGGLRSAGMLAAVADGVVAAADAFAGTLGGVAPIFQLSGLPFVTGSAGDAGRLLAVARPAYQAALRARGLTLLYATPWPPTGLWSRRPVLDAAALQGLRVRTYDAASTAVLAAAGAAPVQLSFADALPRLQAGASDAGALDAVLSSGDGGAGVRLWETLGHFTVLDYAFPLSLAFCAERRLAALPAVVAEGVRDAAEATEARQFRAMTTRVAENAERMRANGVAVGEAPALRAALAAVAAPVVADWAARAGAEGRGILAAYRAGRG